jgi:hypothetical protein
MRAFIIAVILLSADLALAIESTPLSLAPIPLTVDLERARFLTQTWDSQQPERAERLLRVVYWTPSDREPAPAYRARLTRVMRYMQEFYATQMTSYGLGRRSVNLEMEADGLLKLRVARGKNPFNQYRTESGGEIRKDCAALLEAEGLSAADETLVIFCNLGTWDEEKRTMRQNSPYYASGTHRNGTAWQVDSPLLDPDLLGEKTAKLTDGQYGHISVGRYNSIFVGGVVHELGHALGLPHCVEAPSETATRGHALMGSGNRTMGEELRGEGRGTFLTLGHALKLLTHVQFSGSVKRMTEAANVTWSSIGVATDKDGHLVCSGVVEGAIPVYAVIAYADPSGGGDYNAQIGAGVPAANGAFSLIIPSPSASKATTGSLRLVACCVNGAATAYAGSNGKPSYPFALNQGRFDLTPTNMMLDLNASLPAARAGTLTAEARAQLQPQTQAILQRLLAPDHANDKPIPAAVIQSSRSIALSDCRPLSASTGWGGVHYDRLPEQKPLVSDGQLFLHGLYAHANAKHVYQLDNKWSRLGGQCGIATDAHGSVEFIIHGDDKILWRSGPVKPDELKTFSVDLNGIQQLQLETTVTDKGPSGAWGVWLEPLLERG